jgi:hypothetical protein
MSSPIENNDETTEESRDLNAPPVQPKNLTDPISAEDTSGPKTVGRDVSTSSSVIHHLAQTGRARSIDPDVPEAAGSSDMSEEISVAHPSEASLLRQGRQFQVKSGSYHMARDTPNSQQSTLAIPQGDATAEPAITPATNNRKGSSNTNRSYFPIFKRDKRHTTEGGMGRRSSNQIGPYGQEDKSEWTSDRSRWNMGILRDAQTDEVPGKFFE